MTDQLRQAAQQALDFLMTRRMGAESVITALRTALEQQAEPPPEWPLIKNILAVFGLDAIAFVAKWQAAQRQWQGLTDDDWEHIDNKKGTSLDTFVQGATWAEVQLRERNT